MDKFVLGPEPIQGPKILNAVNEEKHREMEIPSPELKTVPGSYTFTDSLHHIEKKNTYVCDSCGKVFLHKHELIEHIKTHLRENSGSLTKESNLFIREPIEKVSCKICNKKYGKDYIKIHERCHTGAKPYSCEVCKKKFAFIGNLKGHKRIHTDERPYSCDVCKKSFNRMDYLQRHKLSHTGEKPYTCKVCKKGFTQISNLKAHMRCHTGEKPYECPTCEKRFVYMSGLRLHKLLHTGDKPYSCEICKKEFIALGELKTHKRIHSGEKPYRCGVCNKGCAQMSNLKSHMRIHTGEKPYQCPICEMRFAHNSALSRHKRSHTGEKSYSGEVCKKEFTALGDLKTHKRIHSEEKSYLLHSPKEDVKCESSTDCVSETGLYAGHVVKNELVLGPVELHRRKEDDNSREEKHREMEIPSPELQTELGSYTFTDSLHHIDQKNTYACDSCAKEFLHKHNLIDHIKTHLRESSDSLTIESLLTREPIYKKPYSCDVCKKNFTKITDLKRHKRSHTGEKPYICGVCNKGYTRMSHLKAHMRIHTGEKPYECPICDERFSQYRGLTRHKRSHTGDKSYSCEICKKAFTALGDLKTHKQIHSGEKPYLPHSLLTAVKVEATEPSQVKEDLKCESSTDCVSETGLHAGHVVKGELVLGPVELHRRKEDDSSREEKCLEIEILSPGLQTEPGSYTFTDSLHHIENKNTYVCESCCKRFLNEHDLIDHIKTHLPESSESMTKASLLTREPIYEKPYSCDVCKKSFIKLHDFKRHKRSHTGEKPYTCGVCKKGWTQMSNLKAHMRIHTGEKPYECPNCGKRFAQWSALESHKRTHTGDKPYSCEICKNKFRHLNTLKNHKCIHTEVNVPNGLNDDLVIKDQFVLAPELIQCPKIVNAVNEEKCLEIEILSPELKTEPGSYTFTDSLHHIEKKNTYVCDSCGERFLNEHDLLHHIKTHLPENSESSTKESLLTREPIYKKPYSCDVCKKRFTKIHSVKRHKRIHTGEKPYTCGVCKKGWKQMSNLKAHMRIHTREKPYECPICEKRFSQYSILARHKRSHTGEKSYFCEICKKEFTALGDLKTHKQIHSGKKSYVPHSLVTAVKVETTDPSQVREDLKCESSTDCVSETGLYAGHVVKDELVLGPVELHRRKEDDNPREEKCLEIEILIPELQTEPGSYTFTDSLHHIDQNTYACDLCAKEFLHKHDLIDHIKTHLRESSDSLRKESLLTREPIYEKPYSCDVCNKCFTKINDLKRHKRSHTGEKPYICGVCKKRCTQMSNLKKHMRIHTREKPYECPICEKRFSQYSGLARHKRSHTGENSYSCEICKKEFTALGDLKTHKRIHSGETPYQPHSLLTAVKVEVTDPSQVKEELKCESSTDCVTETGLYDGHVVKDELVLGPVELHRRKEDNSREEKLLEIEILNPELKTVPGSYTFTDSLHHIEKKNTYGCDSCGKTFLHKPDLIDHVKTHLRENSESLTKENLFMREPIKKVSCKICNKKFRKNYIKIHERCHTGAKPYSCEVCKKAFAILGNLKNHKRVHTEERPYSCDVCKKSFSRLNNLKTHKRSHTGEKPYTCGVCKKGFTQIPNLKSHIRIHTGEKPYECPTCEKRFAQWSALETHKRLHTGDKPYSCEICKKKFRHFSALKTHKVIHAEVNVGKTGVRHGLNDDLVIKDQFVLGSQSLTKESNLFIREAIEKVSCKICNKKFSKNYIKIHERCHTGAKPYSCDVCKKEFAILAYLNVHRRVHTEERPYSCDVCKKSFNRLNNLKTHKRSHTGEKPYTCGVCKKGFTQITNLKSHIRVHTGEKPYECPICEKRFSQWCSLDKHKRSHTGDIPYSCEICKEKFMHLSSLKTHIVIHAEVNVGKTGARHGLNDDLVIKDQFVLAPEPIQCPKIVNAVDEVKRHEIDVSNPELKTVPGSYTSTDSLHHIEKKNTYVCDSCGKTFLHKLDLIDHVKTHLRENSESLIKESDSKSLTKVSCKICNKKFRKNYIKIHERFHTGAKPYSCEVCKKEFTILGSLKEHKRIHTEERPYACDVCKKSFSRLNHLKTHKRSHSGEKPYTCEVCKKGFTQISNLRSHIRIHTGEKPYECPICEKRFAQGSALETHKRTHTGDQPYSCEICKKKFVHVSSLNKHKCIHAEVNVGKIGARHGLNDDLVIKDQFVLGSQPIQCPKIANAVNEEKREEIEIASKTLPGSNTFTDSLHFIEKNNPYMCDSCGKTFLYKHDLIEHVKTHLRANSESLTKESNLFIRESIEKVSCEICNKKYAKGYIKIHERLHTGTKPYSCEVCKKEFADLGNLTNHKRTHTEERPYSCDVCKKDFARSDHLKTHKRTHSGDKPYTCEVCKKGFTQLNNLKRHTRLIHTTKDL